MNTNIIWKIKIFVISFILSSIFFFCFNYVFYVGIQFHSIEVLMPAIGLMFGPIGALGYAISRLFVVLYTGTSFTMAILNITYIFLVTLLPYKLWYGVLRDDYESLVFSSVKNVLKFILIVTITFFILTWGYDLFNITPLMFFDGILTDIPFLLLNIVGSSFSLGLIILLDYLNVGFYLPIKDFRYFDNIPIFNTLNKHPRYYNMLLVLVISIILGTDLVYSIFGIYLPSFYSLILVMVLLALFMFKPIKKIDLKKSPHSSSKSSKSFSFVENLIIFLVVLQAFFIISVLYLYDLGIVPAILPFSKEFSLIIACTIALCAVSIPFILICLFLEINVFRPIENISIAIEGYISKGKISQTNVQIIKDYETMFKDKSIIGDLSSSLVVMNDDLNNYITEITSLNIEKERITTELDVATKIQKSFIPHDFEFFEMFGLNIDGVSIPAKEVGGDFFNVFMVDEDNFAFFIGDASGKGVPASLFMAISMIMIKQQIINEYKQNASDSSLSKAYTHVNNLLWENNHEKMFSSSWAGVLNIKTGRLDFVNAGHEPPVIKHKDKVEFLDCQSGLVLGILKNHHYVQETIFLEEGDRIILYTDGVCDANNPSEEFFGKDRLLESLNKNNLTVSQEIENLKETVSIFTKNQEQFDDFTVLVLGFNKMK